MSILIVTLIRIEMFLFFVLIIEIEIIKFNINDKITNVIIVILSYPVKKEINVYSLHSFCI